ncbi:serine hydrolase domain-containing protein [Paraburkholderia sp. 2C]|jgi:CubicO group peptidase (beta-lactamase class C family)
MPASHNGASSRRQKHLPHPTRLALTLCAAITFLAACSTASRQPGDASNDDEPIGTVRQIYDGALTPDLAVHTFRHIDKLFPTRRIARGDTVSPLADSPRQLTQVQFVSNGKHFDLFDFLSLDRVSGLLILKNDQIVYETYQYGNTPATRWMSMSLAKSITSTLFGAAIKDGLIDSINDPVTRYVPELTGTAYDGVTIRNVLMMSSGVRWDETYTNPNSDRRALLEVQLAQKPGGTIDLMKRLPRAFPPGSRFNYSTGETQVAAEVLHGALKGKTISGYLSEKVWRPLGMQSDATWWLDSPNGVEIGGSGLSATLRDWGRFGVFIENGGAIAGQQVVPTGWTTEAGTPKTLTTGQVSQYGYFWWPVTSGQSVQDGAFAGHGIEGQGLYINPKEKVVIVMWGAQSKPSGTEVINRDDFFNAVVAAVR